MKRGGDDKAKPFINKEQKLRSNAEMQMVSK